MEGWRVHKPPRNRLGVPHLLDTHSDGHIRSYTPPSSAFFLETFPPDVGACLP